MAAQLEIISAANGSEVTANIQNVIHDTESYQQIKINSQKFLEVNEFDMGKEPNFINYSNKEFIKYMEKINEEKADIISKMKELKFDINIRSMMSNVYNHKHFINHKILVFFLPSTKIKGTRIGVEIIKNFIGLLIMLDCTEGLFVSVKNLSSKAIEHINVCNNARGNENIYNITSYTDSTFINITNHVFVPKVLKVYRTKDDIRKFCKDENISVNVMSRLFISDPLVKFYRGKQGDVFKLKRIVTTGNILLNYQIIYRLVI